MPDATCYRWSDIPQEHVTPLLGRDDDSRQETVRPNK